MFLFYLFGAALIFLSWKSFQGGVEYLRYFRKKLSEPSGGYAPPATVFAPCRGVDAGLRENLSALTRQDYPFYELIFVVDDEQDPAAEIIREIIAESPVSSRLVIAGKAADSSQKVHNLREAVRHADRRSEVFVFVDSDARPAKNWLRTLAAPLADDAVGAATGYRWFVSKKRNLASEILSVWNASIASAFGENSKTNFCWGGSTAVRRDVFEKLGIREKWKGTLSDDFAVTRILGEAKKKIVFVPQALTVSFEDKTLAEVLEFTNRQMKITRVYAPHLWKASLFGALLFNFIMIRAAANLFYFSPEDFAFTFSVLVLISVTIFSVGKAWLRWKAVNLALENYRGEIKKQFFPHVTLWLFTPALFLFNALSAAVSRKIFWRGIKYELVSPEKTSIIKENK